MFEKGPAVLHSALKLAHRAVGLLRSAIGQAVIGSKEIVLNGSMTGVRVLTPSQNPGSSNFQVSCWDTQPAIAGVHILVKAWAVPTWPERRTL